MCLLTKTQKRKPFSKLLLLPIHKHPWEVTSVNFIVKLPDSHGFNIAMVIVDSVTKHGHFIPTHMTVTALGSARLYLQHMWKLHGLPRSMVSDRGPQFVAEFMHELYRLLGIKVSASMVYHPQSDGSCITDLMQIWATSLPPDHDPPFANKADLYDTIDSTLVGDVPWESFTISYTSEMGEGEAAPWKLATYNVWYWDPHVVLKSQLANPDFANTKEST
jgi:Plavaka transposase